MMYRFMNNYRNNDCLRNSFNELAQKTFGIDFEDWYLNGFWSDHYNPYSVVEGDRVIANVSVNRTDMVYEGTVRHLLQLGTVMTEESYRNQGLCRKLMEWIEADCGGWAEGTYLFANDSVLDFYPKFGFRKAKEYLCTKKLSNTGECRFEKVPMEGFEQWKALELVMERNVFHGRFDMLGNGGLIMFYVTKYMGESVYYHKGTDTFIIGDWMEGEMLIHQIFSGTLSDFGAVAELLGENVHKVTFGFSPLETERFEMEELREEDCTLFVKGTGMEVLEREKLRIPSLTHA